MRRNDTVKAAALSSVLNVSYAVGNLFLGVKKSSPWFISLGVYYMILCLARFIAVMMSKRAQKRAISRFTGIMLMLTSLPLLAIAVISSFTEVGTRLHEIVMITIALYAFTKITLAVIKLLKAKKRRQAAEPSLRSLSFADALVSIASLQRSMLLSFGDMPKNEICIFNAATGLGVSLIILLMGWYLALISERFVIQKKQRKSEGQDR